MLDKFSVFIILCVYVISNAFASDIPPLPAPLPYSEEQEKSPPSLPTPAKDGDLVLPKLSKEVDKDDSDEEENASPSFIDKGSLPALPSTPEVTKTQAIAPKVENKPAILPAPEVKPAELSPAPVPVVPAPAPVKLDPSPPPAQITTPTPPIVPLPGTVVESPVVPEAPVEVMPTKPLESLPSPVAPSGTKPAKFIEAPPPVEPPAPPAEKPLEPAPVEPTTPINIPAPAVIKPTTVEPKQIESVEVVPSAPVQVVPTLVQPTKPEPVVPPASDNKTPVSDKNKEVHAVPASIIPPHKSGGKIVKHPAAEKPIDPQQARFIKDELIMLRFEDDDVTMGQLTEKAKLEQMSYHEYLKLYDRYLEEVQDYDRAEETSLFIIAHSNEGKEAPKLSRKRLFKEVSDNLKRGDLTNLRVISDNYEILDLIDRRGNNLLHKAAFDNNPTLTKWFIMKGVDIDSLNYNSLAPIDIAEAEQYWQVFNLLEKAGAK